MEPISYHAWNESGWNTTGFCSRNSDETEKPEQTVANDIVYPAGSGLSRRLIPGKGKYPQIHRLDFFGKALVVYFVLHKNER